MNGASRPQVFPFFVGCGRSGTTLIRTIFNEHPVLAIPRESHFIPILVAERRRYERPAAFDTQRLLAALQADERYRRWKLPPKQARRAVAEAADLPDAIRRLYAAYAKRRGKPRYADKTPNYATHIPLLAELFPEARFVHVIRDGRNVALSVLERSFGPNTFDHAMLYWRHRVMTARAAGARLGPGRYLEYRHEDLVSDPEGTVRDICRFLDLDFAREMLRYYQGRQPRSAWHRHLDKPRRRHFEISTTTSHPRTCGWLSYSPATSSRISATTSSRSNSQNARTGKPNAGQPWHDSVSADRSPWIACAGPEPFGPADAWALRP